MHNYIIQTTLLALCYSEMFQPSNGPSAVSITDTRPSQDQQNMYQM